MTARIVRTVLLAAALGLPGQGAALTANRSIALEAAVASRPGPQAASLTLAAGSWLDGEVEAVARLTLGAAVEPGGRGATGAVTPAAGLRWAPDQGRWRPTLAVALGVRLPVAGRATAVATLLQAGLERLLEPGWALGLTVGVRWLAGEGAAGEAALEVRRYF